jgi:serine/threonine protein kinase
VKLDKPDFKIGDAFTDKYEVCEVMQGSMGVVYLLKNLQRKSFMEPEFLCAKTFSPKWISSELAKKIFIQEVENWMLLGRHECIVCAYNYEEVENQPYVYIQYADSGSLKDLPQKGFNPRGSEKDFFTAIWFSFGLALGMKHIYDTLNLPHGDLRIDNVLFKNKYLIKISDFGVMASAKTQMERSTVDDISQFGKAIWYLFTGLEEEPEQIKSRIQYYNWIDPPLRELILDSIAKFSSDGRIFFNDAVNRIKNYFFNRYGYHLLTPEQCHKKTINGMGSLLAKRLSSVLNCTVTIAKSEMTEPASSYINRGASLSDIGLIDDAFDNYLKALKILRRYRESEESKIVWANIQLLLSKISDINKKRDFFQKAL